MILLISLFLFGCEASTEGKTSKRLAQERLLSELKNCDTKFGTDSADRRQMSRDYCIEVLDRIDTLIKEGYFDDDIIPKETVHQAQKDLEDTENATTTQYDELDEIINKITGDI